MSEFESAIYTRILIGAGLVLALGWISTSFMAAGRARAVLEWTSTVAMYSAIASIMTRLLHKFWIDDNIALVVLFGFFCVVFGSGLVVSLVMTVRAAAGRDIGSEAGATH